MTVVCLAGGTGGAKLAAGLQDLVGGQLAVIANTADDTEVHGLLVCPDPDLITYWLADEIDEERGWGIRDDAFVLHERLEQLGAPGSASPTAISPPVCTAPTSSPRAAPDRRAGADLARARGHRDGAAHVRTARPDPGPDARRTRGLQEFLILDRGEAPIEGVELEGIAAATPTPRCSRRWRRRKQ